MGVSPAGHATRTTESVPSWVSGDCGVKALRSVLQAHARGPLADGELRRAIGLVCREARRERLRAEQVIVAVKQTWYSLPEVRGLPSGDTRAALLDRVVRLTIDEFYAERASS